MNKISLKKLVSGLAFLSLASSNMSAKDVSRSIVLTDDQNNKLAAEDTLESTDSFTSKVYASNFKQKDNSMISFIKKNKKIMIPIASIPLLFTTHKCFCKNNNKKPDTPKYKDDEKWLKNVMAEELLNNEIKKLGFSDNETTWIKVLINGFDTKLKVKKGNNTYEISCDDFSKKVEDADYPSFVFFPTYKKSESHTDEIFSEFYLGGEENLAKLKAWQELLKNDTIREPIKASVYNNAYCFLSLFMVLDADDPNFDKKNKEITANSFKDYDLKKITRILESLKIFSDGADELNKLYNIVMNILRNIRNKTPNNDSPNLVNKQFVIAYDEYFIKTNAIPSIYNYNPSTKPKEDLAKIVELPTGLNKESAKIIKLLKDDLKEEYKEKEEEEEEEEEKEYEEKEKEKEKGIDTTILNITEKEKEKKDN